MNIRLLCVGKIKEPFFREAINEYKKRLSKYCTVEIIEVSDEKTKELSSEPEINIIKEKEGERLLKHIRERDYVVALAIEGIQKDSVAFASFINDLGISGNSTIDFVIGGSVGLSKAVLNRSDIQISFSKMTFPHQLMRVILLEQIYRTMRIINNEPYHK